MKRLISAFTVCIGLAITSPAHSANGSERHQVWLGEISDSPHLIKGQLFKQACRADPQGYRICFVVMSREKSPPLGFNIIISVRTPLENPDIKISKDQWPQVFISGSPLFDMNDDANSRVLSFAHREDDAAGWPVVNYSRGSLFGPALGMPDTTLKYALIMNGHTLTAKIPLADGTEHTMELPLEGLNPVLHYLLPECCRSRR